jgi:hypothetical protein
LGARAVKALSTSRTPDDRFIAAHGLLFGLCRATNSLASLHNLQPTKSTHNRHRGPSPHTKNPRPIHLDAQQRQTTDDRFRATPDPHRAHDHTMKYFQQTVDFDYSWEEVSTSNWQKYGPWNEKTPHVIAVDTLSRSMDPATGIVSSDSFTCQRPRFYHCPTATRCSTY